MKHWKRGCATVCAVGLLSSVVAQADEGLAAASVIAKELDEIYYVETPQPGIVLSGYVDVGYIDNFTGGGTNQVGARTVNNSTPKGDFNVNQVMLSLQKGLSDSVEFQAGFTVELGFGEDTTDINGNGTNAAEDFQVYTATVDFMLPVGNGLVVSVGKYPSLLGFESDKRWENINITYGNEYALVAGFNVGVMGAYPVNDLFTLYGAVSNGSGVDDGFSKALSTGGGDDVAFSGAAELTNPDGNATLHAAFHYGVNGSGGLTNDGLPLVIFNQWGSWAPEFAEDKLFLGYSATVGWDDSEGVSGTPGDTSTWFGASLYSKYQFTDIFSLAARAEYTHNDDGAFLSPPVLPTHVDWWSWTLTAGFDLIENVTLRSEYRVDWGKI